MMVQSNYTKLCDLTENEERVLKLVARGYSNKKIAEITRTTLNNIEQYMLSIYSKLGANAQIGEGRDKRVCATLIYWGKLSSDGVLTKTE